MTAGWGAVALAGGLATRMGGGDKPLLALGSGTLLDRVLAALRPGAAAVAVSANGDPARFARFGCAVLDDGAYAGQGPLAGVLAGLRWAGALGLDALLTLPGDTPFAPSGLARSLAPAPAWAASLGRVHPLAALWPVAAEPALAAWMARPGPRGVRAFGESIGMRAVDFPSGAGDPFANVNTPGDLDAARERAG
jgi:molybdopterin-guanine dinucleotide biosynthesis protein A